jgi:uncharacterized integral membrane protein
LLRKIVAAVILVPLAVLIVAFAMANRQTVTVSFDPFSAQSPAAAVTLPLFALVLGVLIIGVVIGGAASWFRQGKWRRSARWLEREAATLRAELAVHRHKAQSTTIPEQIKPPPRLKLKPPVG